MYESKYIWNNEWEIPFSVLDELKEMYLTNDRKNSNPNQNIQRAEITDMEDYYNNLKNNN